MDDKMVKAYKERREGHEDIWNCTVKEFATKILPELKERSRKDRLSIKVIELAVDFLKIKYNDKKLQGTVEYEVSKAIEESLIYYTNVEGL